MNYAGIRLRKYSSTKDDYSNGNGDDDDDEYIDETRLIDDDYDEKSEEKKSFKEKLQTVQDLSTLIMLIIGQIASYIERCKKYLNLIEFFFGNFNFYLSLQCYKFYSALSNMVGRFLYVNGNNNTISNTDSLSNIIMGNK